MLQAKLRSELIKMIYQTGALKVAPANQPFWYTSGTIGPYYINTHFLFDGEETATNLLALIDEKSTDKVNGPKLIAAAIEDRYQSGSMFTRVTDMLVDYIKEHIDPNSFDYVSGGERRDWFFSFQVAKLLNKPHITIYKDMSLSEFRNGETKNIETLGGKNVLHIADLVTFASSYERAWIPALQKIDGKMKYSINVLDRNQGGGAAIQNLGVEFHTLLTIDADFLQESLASGYLNQEQVDIIAAFMKDPTASMKEFLINHPDFMQKALHSDDPKTRARAELCVENNMYDLEG